MIDYQTAFAAWLQQHQKQLVEMSAEEVEDAAEILYAQWLEEQQQAFGGLAPAHYFDAFDADELVDALMAYGTQGWDCPDPLADRIMALQEETKPLLLGALKGTLSLREEGYVFNMLTEMGAEEMIPYCVHLVGTELGARAEQAAEALLPFGEAAAAPCLAILQSNMLCRETTDRLANIVSACETPLPGAAAQMLMLFAERTDARAFYAHCLERTGDESVIPVLEQAMQASDLKYYDYLALRDAYEALSGELLPERTFWADADYLAVEQAGEEHDHD